MADAVYLSNKFAIESEFGAGGWRTDIVESISGAEQRNQRRSVPRRRYEVKYNAQDKTAVREIMDLLDDRRGALNAFRIKDYLNYQLTDETILTASGGEYTAQIKQSLGSANAYSRTIRNIDESTLVVKVNGVTLTTDGSPVEWTVSSTGLITFAVPLSLSDVVSVTCDFFVPVRFDVDEFFVVPGSTGAEVAKIGTIPLIEVIET